MFGSDRSMATAAVVSGNDLIEVQSVPKDDRKKDSDVT